MKVTVRERVILLNALPKEGDILSLRILRKLREDFSFSDEEQKMFEFKFNPELGQVSWDPNYSDVEKEVEIGVRGLEIIKETLESLNKQKKLNAEMIGLYEKFVEKAESL